MGGLRGTVFDVLEAHANILPINLLFCRTQLNAAMQMCTLPSNHPVFPLAQQAASCFINRHKSPLHYLFHLTQLTPATTECTPPSCRHPYYIPAFTTRISPSKEIVLEVARKMHFKLKFKVYSNGSILEGRVGGQPYSTRIIECWV